MSFLFTFIIATLSLASGSGTESTSANTLPESGSSHWLKVVGSEIEITLPPRPVYSAEFYNRMAAATEEEKNTEVDSAQRSQTKNICPKTTRFLTRVYDRLVLGNSLTDFTLNGPGMGLLISCPGTNNDMGSRVNQYNRVIISGDSLRGDKSEEELAFEVAHEISHAILGHSEGLWVDLKKSSQLGSGSKKYKKWSHNNTKNFEKLADEMAIRLMANAGYNLKGGEIALNRFKSKGLWGRWCDWRLDDGHGTPRKRIQRVRAIADQFPHLNSVPMADSSELREAGKEESNFNIPLD